MYIKVGEERAAGGVSRWLRRGGEGEWEVEGSGGEVVCWAVLRWHGTTPPLFTSVLLGERQVWRLHEGTRSSSLWWVVTLGRQGGRRFYCRTRHPSYYL